MLPDEVREAVDRWDSYLHARATSLSVTATPTLHEWQTIRAHLLAREAEVKVLRVKCAGSLANNLCPDHRDKQPGKSCLACTIERTEKRAERAEALLRDCRRFVAWASERLPEAMPTYEKLDAHLSENSHDA